LQHVSHYFTILLQAEAEYESMIQEMMGEEKR
jgi:hypothetical protein